MSYHSLVNSLRNLGQAHMLSGHLLLRNLRHYITRIDRIEFDCLGDFPALQDLKSARTQIRLHSDHTFYETFQVARENVRRVFKDTFDNPLVQIVHIGSSKGRVQRQRLVEYASQTPDVTLTIVGLVVPYLGTSIVWRSSLGVQESSLCHF